MADDNKWGFLENCVHRFLVDNEHSELAQWKVVGPCQRDDAFEDPSVC